MRWSESRAAMVCPLYWLLALAWGPLAAANYPSAPAQPLRYGHPKKSEKFMPAQPGETPSCVKDPRLTFCTDPDDYPKDRIRYLLENDMFDLSSVLQDETRDTYTFEAMNPPAPHYGPQHGYLPPPAMTYSNVSIPSKVTYKGSPSYASYLPPASSPPHASHSPPRGYGPSKFPSNHRGDGPGYMKGSHRHALSFPAPGGNPIKAQAWWRKTSTGSMRYRRQAPAGPDDGDLCPSRAAYIRPRAAQSISGDWMFLVNLDDNPRYTQLVRSETCLQNECSGACQAPPGTTAVCQQQFVQKRLVALDGTGDQLSQDIFWFPSCCVCKIRR
ncbi:Spaetzle [Trinorchestia longiramus]|nr:Spaetzle [Trinorchestia longiramus]